MSKVRDHNDMKTDLRVGYMPYLLAGFKQHHYDTDGLLLLLYTLYICQVGNHSK